jgi:hypothetical protein
MRSTAKRFVLVLVLVAIATGGAFGQDAWNNSFKFDSGPTPQKGALFVDLSYTIAYLLLDGIGLGLGWEGRINDSSTYLISGNFGIYGDDSGFYKYSALDFGGEANYHYYIFKSALDKLFINAGVGFGMKTWNYTYGTGYGGSLKDTSYAWSALYIPLYAGYKLIIGPGLVVEVQAGYRVGIALSRPKDYPSSYTGPAFGSAIYGIALGWAF